MIRLMTRTIEFFKLMGDLSVEGDALHIRNKTWRFGFSDGVHAEPIFQDWKTGTLFRR